MKILNMVFKGKCWGCGRLLPVGKASLCQLCDRAIKEALEALRDRMKGYVKVSLLVVIILAFIDGEFTKYGLIKGYYLGEFNPFVSWLIERLGVSQGVDIRMIIVLLFVSFLCVVYMVGGKEVIIKNNLLIGLVCLVYVVVNIFHVTIYGIFTRGNLI